MFIGVQHVSLVSNSPLHVIVSPCQTPFLPLLSPLHSQPPSPVHPAFSQVSDLPTRLPTFTVITGVQATVVVCLFGPLRWTLTRLPTSSPIQTQISRDLCRAQVHSHHCPASHPFETFPLLQIKSQICPTGQKSSFPWKSTSPTLESDSTCHSHFFFNIDFHIIPAFYPQQPPKVQLCKDMMSSKGIQSNLTLKQWTTQR